MSPPIESPVTGRAGLLQTQAGGRLGLGRSRESRSIAPVAGVPGSTGRSTRVTYGGLPTANRGALKKYTFFEHGPEGAVDVDHDAAWTVSVKTWRSSLREPYAVGQNCFEVARTDHAITFGSENATGLVR